MKEDVRRAAGSLHVWAVEAVVPVPRKTLEGSECGEVVVVDASDAFK